LPNHTLPDSERAQFHDVLEQIMGILDELWPKLPTYASRNKTDIDIKKVHNIVRRCILIFFSFVFYLTIDFQRGFVAVQYQQLSHPTPRYMFTLHNLQILVTQLTEFSRRVDAAILSI